MITRRAPIRRTPVPRKRNRPRPGRLRGNAMKALRLECWLRDGGDCVVCKRPVSLSGKHILWPPMHMAHVKSRGAGGMDVIDNVKTKCPTCHLVLEHNPKCVPRKSA